MKRLRIVAVASVATLLAGCKTVVLSPAGDVAAQQKDILLTSTYLMLLIIVPVMCLVVFFAWKFRAGNKDAEYAPDWSHSTGLEVVIWAAPLLIIICLGGLTWVGTHLLDPYRKINRIDEGVAVTGEHVPLEVEVVSLDWKWLFIYPEYGIATVNELAAPTDRPIEFRLTSSGVMNAFYIPTLVGMIYTMPGMETHLNAVINEEGVYDGFSSNYSGAGFSNMRFKFHALGHDGFEEWVAGVRADMKSLDTDTYLALQAPSEKVPPTYYGTVGEDLYHDIMNMCVEPGRVCMDDMMMQDMHTAMGLGAGGVGHGAEHGSEAASPEAHEMRDTPAAPNPGGHDMHASPPTNGNTGSGQLRGHGLGRDDLSFRIAPFAATAETAPAPAPGAHSHHSH